MKHILIILFAVALTLNSASCQRKTAEDYFISNELPREIKTEGLKDIRVIIKTTKGDIHGTIYASRTPLSAANFLNLSKRGYYDGSVFHRVEPNFVIQGGMSKNGARNPGYTINNETYTEHPDLKDLKHSKGGIFSMARQRQKHTNGSQFFITHKDTPHLDGGYSVFGETTKGLDVVNAVVVGDKILSVEILDSTDALFKAAEKKITEWNTILDKQFKDLKK